MYVVYRGYASDCQGMLTNLFVDKQRRVENVWSLLRTFPSPRYHQLCRCNDEVHSRVPRRSRSLRDQCSCPVHNQHPVRLLFQPSSPFRFSCALLTSRVPNQRIRSSMPARLDHLGRRHWYVAHLALCPYHRLTPGFFFFCSALFPGSCPSLFLFFSCVSCPHLASRRYS